MVKRIMGAYYLSVKEYEEKAQMKLCLEQRDIFYSVVDIAIAEKVMGCYEA